MFFLQNAAGDFRKGFKEGFTSGVDNVETPGTKTYLMHNILTDGRLTGSNKQGNVILNKDYSLENINVAADLRVNDSFVNTPWWLDLTEAIFVFGILFILIRTAYFINKAIYAIYDGTIFQTEKAGKIRHAGFLFIIYFVVDYGYQQLSYLKGTYLTDVPVKIINTSAFDFQLLLIGLLMLIIAEAFKQGVKLREEQELTI